LAEAKETMDRKEEYAFEAEWYRLRGEFLLQQVIPDVTQAVSCFQQAIEVARRQHAKWWELRAATRLCTVWHQQEKRHEAGQLLGEVYGGFTEGFTTIDLREARALLDVLTG
jgi:predicted ATPase